MSYAGMQAILTALMYHDKAQVLRQEYVTDEDGADDYSTVEVYEAIPCKLSQYGKELATDKTDRAMNVSYDFRLCCHPDYDIRPNDIVKVVHMGQEFTLNAGAAFKYPTHQEISLRRERDEA